MLNMTQMNRRDEINAIVDEALREFPGVELDPAFTDLLVSRLEKRLSARDLFFEFALKILLVTGALAILAVVLLFPGTTSKSPVVMMLMSHWQMVTIVASVIFFTFIFDQLLLRLLFRRSRPKS